MSKYARVRVRVGGREGGTDNIFLPSFKAEDDVESSSEAMATTMAPQRERASERGRRSM